ncbi:MAG: enoyl-CoA hydratase/isomerase family protein [Bacteroidetes bacterium]|nr:enoyl-CoA hydratase/isomerase family protein [Bacteroidota bacterium]
MSYKTIKVNISEKIAVLTISRPEALNALNSKVFDEIDEFLTVLTKQPEVRILVITGEGKSFVAGADIAEMANMNQEQGSVFSIKGQNVFNRLESLHIPVIAAVNGFALGGGCELAMSCDFRIASNKAKFGQPEVNLGLIPGYAGTQRLSRLTGMGNALYLLTTAEVISAEEALRIGLVQKVVEAEELMNVVMEIAKKISEKGKLSVQNVKQVTREGYNMPFNEACKLEAEVFGNSFGNGESGEGMNAFLEKRKPNW